MGFPDAAAAPVATPTRRAWRASSAVLIGALVIIVLVSGIASIGFGAVEIPLATTWRIVIGNLWPDAVTRDWSRAQQAIVWDLRLPRIILAGFVGAGLAGVGAALQALTRNPLADPYLFGVSTGASVGAVAVILYTGPLIGALTLPAAAFAGALGAMIAVFAVASSGPGITSERLVLTGVAIAFILAAATNFLIYNATDRGADAAIFWMLGGFGNARWPLLPATVGMVAVGLVYLMWRAPTLNALILGEETARSLGVDMRSFRIELFVASALMTGAMVAASGAIGFVGLMIPHIVRLTTGGDMRRLLPVAMLGGAAFMIWVDAGARALLAPRELPVGVITKSVGGLFFVYLMARRPRL